ncbi:MAG: site-specific DNA-methyltransferase [Armatimonadetes bacterium]|nr:MAG: site-specific DNA-methyltransferase [Armatimonadota bacterium]
MESMKLADRFDPDANAVLFAGDCLDLLRSVPDGLVKLVVTSPPYNLGKSYENRLDIGEYLSLQRSVIEECVRVTSKNGSICWQVGNFVDNGEIVPLDLKLYPIFESLGLRLRNRVVWHFGHGLHASRRFSGRYEVILWFTRTNDYTFNLDAVRVPPKYPNKKHFKGPKAGQLSCNPLGKNPTDVWDIPNVKANHVEKTEHPCQFPVDPFMGVGSAQIAALIHGRRTIGADIEPRYVRIAESRIRAAEAGTLRIRPMERTVYDPSSPKESVPPKYVSLHNREDQMKLLERKTIFPSISRGE